MNNPVHFFLALFFSFSTLQCLSQELNYTIHQGDKVVGELQVCKYKVGQLTTYESYFWLKANLIFPVNLSQNIVANYKDGILLLANAENYLNDNLHSSTFTIRKDGEYKILLDGEKLIHAHQPINYSGVMFYFKEPVEVSENYSESFGTFHTIDPIGKHVYFLKTKNGQENTYTYKNGILTKVIMKNRLATFLIFLNESKSSLGQK